LSKCIKPFINSLPEIYRDALETVDINGISQKALAKELGISHSAVKSRVQRGREMLAALFQSCCTYDLDSRGNIIDYHANPKCC
jgi:RNA polymerase sigma-70 factor (ECF subfamily)